VKMSSESGLYGGVMTGGWVSGGVGRVATAG
jgi:hypothetical protein